MRWRARREMQAAENAGQYAYAAEEQKQKQLKDRMNRYRQHHYYKPRVKDEDKDHLLDEPETPDPSTAIASEAAGQTPDPAQGRKRVERTL